jgi:hypothetical protein
MQPTISQSLVAKCTPRFFIAMEQLEESKMSDTINSMELIYADELKPDQLMIGDLIKVGDDIVEVMFIESDSTADNWTIQTKNEFDELEFATYSYTDLIPLYVFIETYE